LRNLRTLVLDIFRIPVLLLGEWPEQKNGISKSDRFLLYLRLLK
jgi:hypothetical protein